MIKQLVASALLLGNVTSAPLPNRNVENHSYTYTFTDDPTTEEFNYGVFALNGDQYSYDIDTSYLQLADYQVSYSYEYEKAIANTPQDAQTIGTQTSYGIWYTRIKGLNTNIGNHLYFTIKSSLTRVLGPTLNSNDLQIKFVFYQRNYTNFTIQDKIDDIVNGNATFNDLYSYMENTATVGNRETWQMYYTYQNSNIWEINETIDKEITILQSEQEYLMLAYLYCNKEDNIFEVNNADTWLNNQQIIRLTGINQINDNVEVIDLPDVMWTILTMPFTFISIAFNLTLWPSTAYAVNIGNLVLVLLGILIFIMLMKIIISLYSKG